MDQIIHFLSLCRGPSLYSVRFAPYIANGAESLGLSLNSWTYWALSYSRYILPLYLAVHLSAKRPLVEALHTIFKTTVFWFSLISAGFLLKGFGRINNQDYVKFFNAKGVTKSQQYMKGYDFDINYQDVDFELPANQQVKVIYGTKKSFPLHIKFLAKAMVKTFGMILTYPAASPMVKKIQSEIMCQHLAMKMKNFNATAFVLKVDNETRLRALLIQNRKGLRAEKITVYFTGNGETLEVSPIADGLYEVEHDLLIYNRPGFGSSSGMPWPETEARSVVTVMEFVTKKLGYKENEIILHGWSIGGFSASIASYHYPNVHGLIIDASFTTIEHFGAMLFPKSWLPIIECAVTRYLPIHTLPYLAMPGKLPANFFIIVRTADQVMSPPKPDGTIHLNESCTVDLALKVLLIAYREHFVSQTSLEYARDVLSNYGKYKKVVLASVKKNVIDEIVAKHIIMVKARHEDSFPRQTYTSLYKNLSKNAAHLQSGHTL